VWRGRVAAEHLVGPVQPDVRQQLERCPPEVALADGLEAADAEAGAIRHPHLDAITYLANPE
jgi:hypothetical protein